MKVHVVCFEHSVRGRIQKISCIDICCWVRLQIIHRLRSVMVMISYYSSWPVISVRLLFVWPPSELLRDNRFAELYLCTSRYGIPLYSMAVFANNVSKASSPAVSPVTNEERTCCYHAVICKSPTFFKRLFPKNAVISASFMKCRLIRSGSDATVGTNLHSLRQPPAMCESKNNADRH